MHRDSALFDLITAENQRQIEGIELIASENFTSPAVMEAVGSVLTNKYAEGYPGKRYYGGCQIVDLVEDLARNRAAELFDAEYVNVQPHSGSQANAAVYLAASSRATPSSALTSAMAGTSRTDRRSTLAARPTEPPFMA